MGWRKPPDAVIVPHPTGWANPYNVAEYGQAGAAARRELAGKTLACCCPPGLPCHADVPPTSGTNTKGPNPVQRRCNATAAPPASPAATRHGRRAPLQDARRIPGFSPQAQRAAVRRVLEAQMRGYVAVMMAERQACFDDLAMPGLTPAVYGSSGASGPPPTAHEPRPVGNPTRRASP